MADQPAITLRKAPRQARSTQLVADILEAAARVLAAEGARRFTTARVAERAGVSVGSLYQYFPNKAALLFRLQTDEWTATSAMMCGILEDRTLPPLDRVRRLVHAFVRSECEEAEMRRALADAAPYYRDAPEAEAPRHGTRRVVQTFLAEALPDCTQEVREVAGTVIKMTLSEVGKRLSEEPALADRIAVHADALADMMIAYLGRLAAEPLRVRNILP